MSNLMTNDDVLERSPYLDKLKRTARLAPSRLADLLAAVSPASPALPLTPADTRCS